MARVLIYIIGRGGKMSERQMEAAAAQERAARAYIQGAAGSGSTANELELADLKSTGVLPPGANPDCAT